MFFLIKIFRFHFYCLLLLLTTLLIFLFTEPTFLLVLLFTYFYTTVVFKPKDIADQLRKNGSFIPGIRPGQATEKRLSYLLSRVTVIGAVFLGAVAVLPNLAQRVTGISTLTVGGTGILIVVSVIIELTRKIENVVQMYRYERFTR